MIKVEGVELNSHPGGSSWLNNEKCTPSIITPLRNNRSFLIISIFNLDFTNDW
jgi:hypothetical protein